MKAEVVTLGEAMLRMSVPAGASLEDARRLDVHIAGAEANTAVALAALGRSVSWWSRLPDNPLGRRVARELRSAQVDISEVRWVPDARMGTYYVELAAPPRPVSVVYDRTDSAASGMHSDDFPLDTIADARVAHLSGITPALSPSCRELASAFAERARSAGTQLTLDVNYRAKLWPTTEARRALIEIGTGADVVVVTREDARDVMGIAGATDSALEELRDAFNARAIVMTDGSEGAAWVSDDGAGVVDALPTQIVDRLGAGDAFMAGVIEGLLNGELERGLRIGAALASIALGTNGDQVVTTSEQIRRLVAGGGRGVDR